MKSNCTYRSLPNRFTTKKPWDKQLLDENIALSCLKAKIIETFFFCTKVPTLLRRSGAIKVLWAGGEGKMNKKKTFVSFRFFFLFIPAFFLLTSKSVRERQAQTHHNIIDFLIFARFSASNLKIKKKYYVARVHNMYVNVFA